MPTVPACPHLEAVITSVETAEPGLLDRLGIGRLRRSNRRHSGTCLLEQGGRSPLGGYLELKLRHREADCEVRAGLVAYRPSACERDPTHKVAG